MKRVMLLGMAIVLAGWGCAADTTRKSRATMDDPPPAQDAYALCMNAAAGEWASFQGPEFADFEGKLEYVKAHDFPGTNPACVDARRTIYTLRLFDCRDQYGGQWTAAAHQYCTQQITAPEWWQQRQNIQWGYMNFGLPGVISEFNTVVAAECSE